MLLVQVSNKTVSLTSVAAQMMVDIVICSSLLAQSLRGSLSQIVGCGIIRGWHPELSIPFGNKAALPRRMVVDFWQ